MEFLKSKMLCVRLTEDLYDRLNLQTSNYSEFFLKEMLKIYCREENQTVSNWRVCYPGLQSSILLLKRPSSLSSRELDAESLVSVVHKLVVTSMATK
jgi:hypothetical protein